MLLALSSIGCFSRNHATTVPSTSSMLTAPSPGQQEQPLACFSAMRVHRPRSCAAAIAR